MLHTFVYFYVLKVKIDAWTLVVEKSTYLSGGQNNGLEWLLFLTTANHCGHRGVLKCHF